jgi:hypothetical protein
MVLAFSEVEVEEMDGFWAVLGVYPVEEVSGYFVA